jgi:hypothetical protein
MTGWKKSTWLNLGRDIKSSQVTKFNFCTASTCRGNQFNLTSAVTQTVYIGIGTHDERDYVGCTINPNLYQYAKV